VNEHDTSQKRWVREGQLHREGLIPEIEAYLEELFRAARFKLQAKIRERPDSTEEVEGVEIEVELDARRARCRPPAGAQGGAAAGARAPDPAPFAAGTRLPRPHSL
jgi:hypothetical protein